VGGGAAALNGRVQVDIGLRGAPPGTTATARTSGIAEAAPPRVERAMPNGALRRAAALGRCPTLTNLTLRRRGPQRVPEGARRNETARKAMPGEGFEPRPSVYKPL
jgi:hypothetical protein